MENDSEIHPEYVIGIDPDVSKCGVALYEANTNKMMLKTCAPVEVIDMLDCFQRHGNILKVYIEASHNTTSNWHLMSHDKPSVAAKKGYSVGRCHEVGILLVDYCRHNAIPFEEVAPLIKIWNGQDKKCTHENLIHALSPRNIEIDEKHAKRSNQEERDACLIILGKVRLYTRKFNN